MIGVCSECKQVCGVIREDVGYGITEMHGNVSNDVRWVASSDCCGAEAYRDIEDGELIHLIDLEELQDYNDAQCED